MKRFLNIGLLLGLTILAMRFLIMNCSVETKSISAQDHFIDFFVITFADLVAAGIAYRFFEQKQKSRDEERFKQQERIRKAEGRLEVLSKMTSPVSTWVDARILGFKDSEGNSSMHFSPSESWDPWAIALAEIKDDLTFWNFIEGEKFKSIILSINESFKKLMGSRTVGSAKAVLDELRNKIDDFQKAVGSALE